eukprot:g4146.t1
MGLALDSLASRPDMALIDGLPVRGLSVPHEALVKGDGLSLSIAAASVIAKGRGGGEVDIVARQGRQLLFVEVKTRKKDAKLRGLAAVNEKKRRLIRRGANEWLKRLGTRDVRWRFDVVEVDVEEGERPKKFAGPDTRVTAPANAVAGSGSNTTPYVTGVWRSWEGKDHDQSNGLPSAPNYASKLADGDFEIDSSEDGRFLGWLVSGTEQSNGATDPPTVDKAANTVPLLAEGTLGSGTDKEVHLVPTEIGDDGAYAWWIEGENTKAYMADKGDEPSTVAEWSQNLASNGQPDVEEFGFSDPDELATVPTRKSLDLASNTFKVGSVEQNDFYPLYYQMGNAVNLTFIMPNDTADWQPGETRTYSPSNFSKFSRFQMKRGYLSPFGTSAAILANGKSGTQLSGTATDPITVSIKAISDSDFTLETLQWNGTITNNVAHSYLVPANDITRFWPPETVQNTTQTMGNLAAGGPSPFLTAMLQLQNIYTYSAGSRGYTHRKPITGILSANIQGKSAPAGHLDALPFDWVFRYPNGSSGIGTDSGLPVDNIDESDPDGFIGTSYRFEDGLTSMVAAELPRMPLRSLGELQHFDVGYYSPMAPYVAEPIGNSNASFLIAPDEVYINDGYGTAERVSYDHSYVGNHLFFDDWFVSSIAPETSGTSSSAIRSMEEVYSDFLSVAEPLPNRSYLPAKPLSDSEAAAAASDLVADKTAWHSVASNIEVEGMFNVNSTSVEAWTALLKHLKEAEVPYVSGSSVVLESGVDHPVSRTTVAGDPAAQAEVYSTVGCHKRLTDKQIEALATEIVEQVKKRGPFLSLSEFVNRRLTSSDTELALSGAVEAALSELATRGADENPFADLQATFTENVSVPSGGSYEFPEATQGNLAYGFPGWIRQADVLRPLAPVLSARDDTFVIRAYGESRSTNGDIARENARVALMLAIADLQVKAGPDTRITATAEAVADVNGSPYVTGVWRSWEGLDHDAATGLPIEPDYPSKRTTYNNNSGRFLGWLVSGPEKDNDANNPPSIDESSGTVPLLAGGSLGNGTDKEVHLIPTDIDDSGAYAWWVQGENQKALMMPEGKEPSDNGEWSDKLASNGRPDTDDLGFSDDSELVHAFSRNSLDLAANSNFPGTANPKVGGSFFHDISAYSRGLLTNAATGGWKKDLSLMAEKWNRGSGSFPTTGFPVFRTEPFEDEVTRSLRLRDHPADASIYPWVTQDGVTMSWQALLDYVSLYKEVQKNATSGEPYFVGRPTITSDWVAIQAVLARVHVAFGYDATKSGEVYTPRFLFKPSVTMWNPYNVAIESSPTTLIHMYQDCFPFLLYVTVGNQPEVPVNIQDLMETSGSSPYMRMQTNLTTSDDQTLKPGESRMFGKQGEAEGGIQVIYLDPGFRIAGSYVRNLSAGAAVLPGAADDKFSYRWEHKAVGGNVSANLQYFWSRNKNSPDGTNLNPKWLKYWMKTPENTAVEKLPLPDLVNDSETLGGAYEEDSPFLSVSIGLRTLRNEDLSGQLAKIHTKGYFYTNPISSNPDNTTVTRDVSAEDSPYTWEVFAPNSWEDAYIPQSEDSAAYGSDHAGFVGSSFQAGAGLRRWAIAELPTQPLLSLCELQHFDLGFRNPYPPRVANAIGNSHAMPHIDSAEIKGTTDFSYDHSYASNHVLFDDWFISSITPENELYTQNEVRSVEDVYADHLSLNVPLRNRHYLPAHPLSDTDAVTAAGEILSDDSVWQDIASEIEVEGMFNINSTSVDAWKAVLMSQRDTQVPYSSVGAATADDWDTQLQDSAGETAVSRTTVAGDPSAADSVYSTAVKHMTFSDGEIEALATEIVNQVKERGPFLSLSEFINRQLGTDDDLAMAGAVETALMKLAEAASDNPYEDIQAAYPEQAVEPSDAGSIYAYKEAAVGDAAYGTPGWARQADILRPLAPIMSPRDDTFVIRAYGDARNSNSGDITAKVWCEAVVQRRADYVDPLDSATEHSDLQSEMNRKFGRRFQIVSFRWLSPDEI